MSTSWLTCLYLSMTDTCYSYRMFGLHFASSISFPACKSHKAEPDVYIRFGSVPDALHEVRTQGVLYQAAPGRLLIKLDGIAKYLVQAGKEIVIEPDCAADEDTIRLFLFTSPLGALFHQRGLLALHGSEKWVDFSGGISHKLQVEISYPLKRIAM